MLAIAFASEGGWRQGVLCDVIYVLCAVRRASCTVCCVSCAVYRRVPWPRGYCT